MTKYEMLLREAEQLNLIVNDEVDLGYQVKGLYVEKKNCNLILLSKKIESSNLKRCVLAEELGHYHTSQGNILDQSKVNNRKQEKRARAWAYESLVSFNILIEAYQNRVNTRYDLAEYIGVTELFLEDAIKYYNQKHGSFVKIDRFTIFFDPLGVMENFE